MTVCETEHSILSTNVWAWCNCRQVHVSLNGGNNQRAASFKVVLLRDWQKGNC